MILEKVDHPENIVFYKDTSTLKVLGGSWETIPDMEPVKWSYAPDDKLQQYGEITLKEIQQQYGDKYGMLIVVYETYLNGTIYRIGNYSDGAWYQIGELSGFA